MDKLNIFIDEKFSAIYEHFPIVFVDAGASGGIPKRLRIAERHLKTIGFEPDIRSEGDFLRRGIYKEKGTLDFYLARTKTDSSVFRPNQEFLDLFPNPERFEASGAQTIEVDTLDNQLKEKNIGDVDLIKADIQGCELAALEGAEEILKSVFGIEIEIEFMPIYKNQPLFDEVNDFLRKRGFELWDFEPVYWKRKIGKNLAGAKGQIIYANALYFKGEKQFSENAAKIGGSEFKKSKILRAISVCLLYGYLDYALTICESSKNILGEEDYGFISKYINKFKKKEYVYFPGRARLMVFCRRMWRLLGGSEYKNKWHIVGKSLGNTD